MGVPASPRAHTSSVPASCLAPRGTACLLPTGCPCPRCPPHHTPSPAAAVAPRQPEPRRPHSMSGQHLGQWCSKPQSSREQPPDFALLCCRVFSPLVSAAALPLSGSEFPVSWPQLPRESGTARCNSCAPLWRTRALGTLASSPVGFWRAGGHMLWFVHAPEQPCSSAPRVCCSF